MAKLARNLVILIAAEDFAIALCFLATGKWRLAGFWAAIGVTNVLASQLS